MNAPPSAMAFYRAAIVATAQAPQPRYMTYTLKSDAGGGYAVRFYQQGSNVWIALSPAHVSQTFQVEHRTQDYATQIVEPDGKRWVTTRSLFDPTWYGVYRALHDGMLNYQDAAPPLPDARPAPEPESLKTIVAVSVMGPSIYAVDDAGAAACANGDPGHALLLHAVDHDRRHQLGAATVDLRNMRFCSLRFDVPSSALGFAGYVEENFGDVDGYWIETSGEVHGTARALGIAINHGTWSYTLDDMAFPAAIAPADFAASSGTANR